MESGSKFDAEPTKPPLAGGFASLDILLRVVLFIISLIGLILMVTSNETTDITIASFSVKATAKYDMSPANTYFVVAAAVVCFYSMASSLVYLTAASKPENITNLLLHLIHGDALMLGIMASATGAAGAAAYIGLKGNEHAGWVEVCSHFHPYCKHIGIAVTCSLIASIFLLLMTYLSARSLRRSVPPN